MTSPFFLHSSSLTYSLSSLTFPFSPFFLFHQVSNSSLIEFPFSLPSFIPTFLTAIPQFSPSHFFLLQVSSFSSNFASLFFSVTSFTSQLISFFIHSPLYPCFLSLTSLLPSIHHLNFFHITSLVSSSTLLSTFLIFLYLPNISPFIHYLNSFRSYPSVLSPILPVSTPPPPPPVRLRLTSPP